MELPTTQTTETVNGQSVTINQSPAQECWRLVHDGTTVLLRDQRPGITACIHQLYCAETEAEIDAEIERLSLQL